MSNKTIKLAELSRDLRISKGYRADSAPDGIGTGFDELDRRLPGRGWPPAAVTELLVPRYGAGELELLLPALAGIAGRGRRIVWVQPPFQPYPAALQARGLDTHRFYCLDLDRQASQQALWAVVQLLRSGLCGAVLLWMQALRMQQLRRLQLAAEQGGSCAFLIRDQQAASQPSTAALRLRLDLQADGLQLQILKCRGLTRSQPFKLRKRCQPPGCNAVH